MRLIGLAVVLVRLLLSADDARAADQESCSGYYRGLPAVPQQSTDADAYCGQNPDGSAKQPCYRWGTLKCIDGSGPIWSLPEGWALPGGIPDEAANFQCSSTCPAKWPCKPGEVRACTGIGGRSGTQLCVQVSTSSSAWQTCKVPYVVTPTCPVPTAMSGRSEEPIKFNARTCSALR